MGANLIGAKLGKCMKLWNVHWQESVRWLCHRHSFGANPSMFAALKGIATLAKIRLCEFLG